MGLLDSVLGAVMNGAAQNASASSPWSGGGLGGLVSMAANNPQLVQMVLELLDPQKSAIGGLPGLLERLQQAGLGDMVASWLGNGPNAALSGEQLGRVLGEGPLAQVAAQLGVRPSDAASQLSQLLPGLIDQLTPNGQLPASLQSAAPDLLAMLNGVLKPRS